jgi:hypothetical protein
MRRESLLERRFSIKFFDGPVSHTVANKDNIFHKIPFSITTQEQQSDKRLL